MRFLEDLIFRLGRKKLEQYIKSINLQDGSVLDVACGYGFYSQLFPRNYTGIDIDSKAVDIARKKYPNACFEVMDASKLEFPDEHFVLSFSVISFHHLNNEDVTKAFNEMVRVTKKGGYILILDMVLPKRLRLLAYPVFYFDKGAYRRTFEQLSKLLKADIKPRVQKLVRFLNLGSVVFEYKR